MIKCHFVFLGYFFEFMPFCRCCVVSSLHFVTGVHLDVVYYRHHVLSGVSVGLSSHTDELRRVSCDAAFFFKLTDAGIFGVFTIVYEASRECESTNKRGPSSSDEKNVVFLLELLGDDGVNC